MIYMQKQQLWSNPAEKTKPNLINRGVKQGEPMSPNLSNIALDSLICTFQKNGQGVLLKNGEQQASCAALTFAEGVAILNDSCNGMIENPANIMHAYRLEINVRKTKSFHMVTKRKTYVFNPLNNWLINKGSIEYINPGEI